MDHRVLSCHWYTNEYTLIIAPSRVQVAGLRAMGGEALPPLRAVTRLAVRTERLDLMQPLGLFFPTLSHLELG